MWVSGSGTCLFESCRTSLFEVDHHSCIGIGSHLAEYLNDVFFPPGERPSVRIAEPFAAYIVGQSKRYVQFCGGRTFVRALLDEGTDERVWNEEIRASEDCIEGFFTSVGHMRAALGHGLQPQDIDMAPFTKALQETIVEFRAKQQVYRDKRAAISQRSRGLRL
jgi:hypothetical protein